MRKAADPKLQNASTSRLAAAVKKAAPAAKKSASAKSSGAAATKRRPAAQRPAAAKKSTPAVQTAGAGDTISTPAGSAIPLPAPMPGIPAAARVTLAAECVVRHGAALQAQLLATVSRTDEVVVEAAAVTRIDAAGLQLLVAFARREADAGRRIRWEQPSPELVDSAARVGLAGVLGLDVTAGATS